MAKRNTKTASIGLAKPAPAKVSKSVKRPSGPKKTNAAKKAPAPLAPFDGSVSHLIHRAEQCAGDLFARIAPSGVVTPRQFAILDEISTNPGISQTGLVNKTGIDRSTLADIVRRMLDKGLVQRERTPEDARAYAVKLTRKGASTLKRMQPVAEKVDKQLLDAIPRDQRDVFVSVLAQLVASLSDDEEEQAA